GLVQVVDDERVPVVVGTEHRPGQRLRDLDAIAVVVVHDVLAPVRRRAREAVVGRLAALRIAIVPVYLPVATVRLGNGIHQRDHFVAYTRNVRIVTHR